jgi:predicted RNA-binding protein associated with RNAse of E/G family
VPRTVDVRARKWPDSPHWEHEAVALGADGWGQWVGVAKGTWISRPGAGFHAHCDQVVLLPHDAWWVATFYGDDAERPVDIYVDITTPVTWDGDLAHSVDLDLDVVRGLSGQIWVDDEDEFAEHRVSLGYPDDVVKQALAACERVHAALVAGDPPFDGTARDWLARFRAG